MQIFKGRQHWGHSRHIGTSKELSGIHLNFTCFPTKVFFLLQDHRRHTTLLFSPGTWISSFPPRSLQLPQLWGLTAICFSLFSSRRQTPQTENTSLHPRVPLSDNTLWKTHFFPKDLSIFMCAGILPASMYVLHTCAVPEEAGTGVTDRRELPCGDMWGLGTAPWSSQPSLQPRERHISIAYHCCLPRTGEAGSVSRL